MIFPSRYQPRRRPNRHGRPRRLRLESLEERRLLAVLTVDTNLDVVDAADGMTSLREAIVTANDLAGADEIVFDFRHDGPVTIKLEHGELQLTEAVSIVGGGPELLTIDAQKQSRIFNITAEYGDFTIESLTLTNGKTTGEEEFGGAIQFWRGALTIQNSVVKDSSATGSGGGIGGGVYSEEGDWLTVNSSTIFGNSAATDGGGIASFGGVTINSSTIAENSVTGRFGSGGGISAYHASVNSSTISGNWATRSGGGIEAAEVSVNSSTISENGTFGSGGGVSFCFSAGVTSSTIMGNRASGGGGISSSYFNCPAYLTISNSIVAGNEVDGANTTDVPSVELTMRHSLIGYLSLFSEAPVGSPDANGNLIGGPTGGAVNPHLGPLADNGGPTLTHAPLPGSPAIDAGDPLAVAGNDGVPQFDQRDAPYSRIVEGRIDMGSFESQIASVDFNDDHQLRCDDVDALAAAIVEGTNPPRFDLTADGIVDRADVDVWLTLAGLENRPSHEAYLTGDVDLNGKVDASDLDVVGHNWLQDVTGWCSADFNTDGRVDARDLNLLALNWHQDEFAKTNARAPRAPLANRMAAPNSGSPQGRFEFAVKSPPMFSPGDRSIESAAEYVTPSHLAKRYVPRELRSSSAYIDSSTHEADESQVQVEIVDFVLWRWNNRG